VGVVVQNSGEGRDRRRRPRRRRQYYEATSRPHSKKDCNRRYVPGKGRQARWARHDDEPTGRVSSFLLFRRNNGEATGRVTAAVRVCKKCRRPGLCFLQSRFTSATPKGCRPRTTRQGKVSCAFLSKYTLTFPLSYTHARVPACSSLQGNA
jgi:hypothetical protein